MRQAGRTEFLPDNQLVDLTVTPDIFNLARTNTDPSEKKATIKIVSVMEFGQLTPKHDGFLTGLSN